ncbi:MAG: cytochrome c maturation protein CcmE [bacterium]|nr:cytochrome c maturation protein CcmE [bacterium]
MKKKQIILFVVIILGGLGYLLWGGLEENLVYFVTPSELTAKGEAAIGNPVRLGGMVVEGSIQSDKNRTSFRIKDNKDQITIITYVTPPQMFQEGIGVVVEGALQPDKTFLADRLMVKHGNEYRPPKEGEMPQEIYKQMMKQ